MATASGFRCVMIRGRRWRKTMTTSIVTTTADNTAAEYGMGRRCNAPANRTAPETISNWITIWIEVRTSMRLSSSNASDVAVFPFGPSTRRRTETLFALRSAMSMVASNPSAMTNPTAIRTSVPLRIEIFAASGVRSSSFHRCRSRGHIPSDAEVHAEPDDARSFRN